MKAVVLLTLLLAAGCSNTSPCSAEQEAILAPLGGLKKSMTQTRDICQYDPESQECFEARNSLKALKVCYYHLTR
jgi:hypothetical protein